MSLVRLGKNVWAWIVNEDDWARILGHYIVGFSLRPVDRLGHYPVGLSLSGPIG